MCGQLFKLLVAGHVRRHGDGAAPQGADLPGDTFDVGAGARRDGHIRTGPRQAQRDAAADAFAGAGDHRDAARQIE